MRSGSGLRLAVLYVGTPTGVSVGIIAGMCLMMGRERAAAVEPSSGRTIERAAAMREDRMLYLSGVVNDAVLGHPRMGVMLTPIMANAPDLTACKWAADNGCFKQPHRFSLSGYLAFLEARTAYRGNCLFATAPDVVGDAEATWERSRPVLPVLRDLGYPAALVGQDGMEHMRVEWDMFDALFIGGSTEWKLSEAAYTLAAEAKWRGKHTHMGRVNSYRRILAGRTAGYDSADGTFLAWAPDTNLARVDEWFRKLDAEPVLWVDVSA